MKYFLLVTMLASFSLTQVASAEPVDLGENFHFEEVKDSKRGVASGDQVESDGAIEPAPEQADEPAETDRAVASDLEQDPVHTGVRYWKFKQ